MRSSKTPQIVVFLALALALGACGDKVESTGRRGAGGKAGARKGGSKSSSSSKSRKRKKRRSSRRGKTRFSAQNVVEMTEQEFVANNEANRDPFRSFLQPENVEVAQVSFEDTRLVLLEGYELAELKLTGIVGGRRRHAMFRSPDNRTTNVTKGVKLSKSNALIMEIAEDHVILQIPQLTDSQKPTFVERILWVDKNRKVVEIGSKPLRPDEEGIRY